MKRRKTNTPYTVSKQSYGNPDRCVTTKTERPHSQFAQEKWVEYGEEFTRLSEVTKSDKVNATPWSFHKLVLDNPPSLVSGKYGSPADLRPFCVDEEYANEYHLDGGGLWPVYRNDLKTPRLPKQVTEKIDSISILKAQANLRKATASLPMLYKERKATVKTIGLYSRAILNNVITMQRRDLKKWLRAVKKHKSRPDKLKVVANTIANRHLEFVFGVLPLLDDILGLCDHLTQERITFRTGRGRMTHVERHTTHSVQPPGWGGAIACEKLTTVRYSVRTAIRCDIDSTILNDASLLGFNPIYAWYDMTPLSFVVGWFSNLNHWLQSLDGIPGLTFRTGYSTKRTEVTVSITGKPLSRRTGATKIRGFGSFRNTGSSILQNRIVLTKMPGLQSLYFVDNVSFFAAAATVSLSVQRLVKTANHEITAKPFKYRGRRPRFLKSIKYKRV